MRVIHGYWKCERCGQSGKLPAPGGDWTRSDENAAFVRKHIEGCFTEEEFARGIGNDEFFVGTLKIHP